MPAQVMAALRASLHHEPDIPTEDKQPDQTQPEPDEFSKDRSSALTAITTSSHGSPRQQVGRGLDQLPDNDAARPERRSG